MTAVPPEALRIITAAIDDHRVLTPPDESTPAVLAEAIAVYLISSGWAITRPAPHANTPEEALMPFISDIRSRPHAGTEPAHHWAERAACSGPEAVRFGTSEEAARAICGPCPVRTECLDGALVEEAGLRYSFREGIRGGLNARERWTLATRPRPVPEPEGDVEKAKALLLAAELTDLEITARTQVTRQTLARLRRAANIRPAWPEVALRFHARTLVAFDGHLMWTGRPHLDVAGVQFNSHRVAFRLGHGRPPAGAVTLTCGTTGCVAWEHLADQPMRDKAPKGPATLLPAVVEYLYGIEAGHWESDDVWVPQRVIRFRVVRKTASRIVYIRREGNPPTFGHVNRHRIEADGEDYRSTGRRWETLYLHPPVLAPSILDAQAAARNLIEARRAMADAHPEHGGTETDFIAARAAYETARQACETAEARR